MKRCTMALVPIAPKFAAMSTNDGLADRQPQAKSVWLGGMKCLKNILIITLEAVAVVPDRETKPDPLIDAAEGKKFFTGSIVLHGLASIFNKVQEHLLDRDPVGLECWQFF